MKLLRMGGYRPTALITRYNNQAASYHCASNAKGGTVGYDSSIEVSRYLAKVKANYQPIHHLFAFYVLVKVRVDWVGYFKPKYTFSTALFSHTHDFLKLFPRARISKPTIMKKAMSSDLLNLSLLLRYCTTSLGLYRCKGTGTLGGYMFMTIVNVFSRVRVRHDSQPGGGVAAARWREAVCDLTCFSSERYLRIELDLPVKRGTGMPSIYSDKISPNLQKTQPNHNHCHLSS